MGPRTGLDLLETCTIACPLSIRLSCACRCTNNTTGTWPQIYCQYDIHVGTGVLKIRHACGNRYTKSIPRGHSDPHNPSRTVPPTNCFKLNSIVKFCNTVRHVVKTLTSIGHISDACKLLRQEICKFLT